MWSGTDDERPARGFEEADRVRMRLRDAAEGVEKPGVGCGCGFAFPDPGDHAAVHAVLARLLRSG
jgi:hypothetical protein